MLVAGVSYAALCAYVYLSPSLPDVAALRDVRLQVPLRVYTRDGRLISQIGEYRRMPVSYEDVPQRLVQAVLATEDDRFFEHSGVDYISLMRAMANYLVYGQQSQAGGGGTITMQLARNIFFTPEFSYRRKLSEIFLAFRIESSFKKQEILTLYLNKIFLGQRAYGVAAAAEVYFGKTLDQLTLAETATIAGLPQAPSRDNPISNPERAKLRRAYVLRRMHETDQINDTDYRAALNVPMTARLHGPAAEVEAPYVAEMARAEAFARYGEDIYTAGYKVVTTVDSRLQQASNAAVRLGLMEYDRRHGYRGPLAQVEAGSYVYSDGKLVLDQLSTLLSQYPSIHILRPALVTKVAERSARVALADGTELPMEWVGMAWARRTLPRGLGPEPKTAAEVLAAGDVVYIVRTGATVQLAQLPIGQSALVAVDPRDGAIVALNGGFDYFVSKYNRAVQAKRQPGSAFKPFIYSAALENGFTPASVVLDAPVVFDDASSEDNWRPENSTGDFHGPTRLREALFKSRNLVSVRVMRTMGIAQTVDYLNTHFGFPTEILPRDLTLALGSLQLAPVEVATGYATFANGGYRVQSYLIERIEDSSGKAVYSANPAIVCSACEETANTGPEGLLGLLPRSTDATFLNAADAMRIGASLPEKQIAPRAISAQNAWIMTDMMSDVVRRGTAQRAKVLNRNDLAGKTGTTNDQHDAWFCGFNANIVAAAWVGFDQAATLGSGEEGGRTALPIWIHFMREALRGTPEARLSAPSGLVTVKIDPLTGKLAHADDPNAIFETFIEGHMPEAPDPFDRNADRKTKKDDPLF